MEYISSDTNVWIDFSVIDEIQLPFLLPITYIMARDAVEDEILSPPDLHRRLVSNGLVPVDLDDAELRLVEEYGKKYIRLSVYDRMALAIAKNRVLTLLTGDKALRVSAGLEDVPVIGTIKILDMLVEQSIITTNTYINCLNKLSKCNGKSIRLPKAEIESRILKYKC